MDMNACESTVAVTTSTSEASLDQNAPPIIMLTYCDGVIKKKYKRDEEIVETTDLKDLRLIKANKVIIRQKYENDQQ